MTEGNRAGVSSEKHARPLWIGVPGDTSASYGGDVITDVTKKAEKCESHGSKRTTKRHPLIVQEPEQEAMPRLPNFSWDGPRVKSHGK